MPSPPNIPLPHTIVGEGPDPLVLLHGFLAQGRNLATLARKLAAQTPRWRVIVPDLPGHGDGPALPPGATLETLADGVAALVDALAPAGRVELMGHSLGGRVSLALARRPAWRPRVAAVTLLDIAPGPIAPADADSARLVGAMASGPRHAASKDAFREHLTAAGVQKALVDWQMLNLVEDAQGARWRMDPGALAALHPFVNAADLWDGVEGAPYRVHEIRGRRSPYVSDADAARLAAAGARVDTLEGVGHYVHTEGLAALLAALAAAS